MSIFSMYLQLGFQHIIDIRGYDHILFVVTLCSIYLFSDWRHVIVLVTAFTIGHSITLALSTLHLIHINSKLIEFLISLTIFLTAVANILVKKDNLSQKLYRFKYITALFFGLIHGMGFSNYLRSLLGNQENIVKPLFAFNLGLELGQLIIVFSILSLATIFVKYLNSSKREWSLVLSGAGLGISLILMLERSGILT
jgi:hypothetical protein